MNFVSADLNDGLVSYYSADIEMNTTDSLYLHNLTNVANIIMMEK